MCVYSEVISSCIINIYATVLVCLLLRGTGLLDLEVVL